MIGISAQIIRVAVKRIPCVKTSTQGCGNNFRIYRDAAKRGKEDQVIVSMKVIDYVSGMTDDYIMMVHELALKEFS